MPARWLHAAANASATSVGASTPVTCLPTLARVAASAVPISGAFPEISSGAAASCTNAPRGSPPSGGSHQPNSNPPDVGRASRASCAADNSSVFSAARDLR